MEKLSAYLLNAIGKNRFVSITGGGGKTSLTRLLGKTYRGQGESVLLSTTTKFQAPVRFQWETDEVVSVFEELEAVKGKSVLYGREHESGTKWMYSGEEDLAAASRLFDRTIIEADGAKLLPLKFHTERDPVIHPLSTYTIAVLGAVAIGRSRRETAFGYQGEEGLVDRDFLNGYLTRPECLLKGNPNLILVNGMDAIGEKEREILDSLSWPKVPIVFGSILKDEMEKTINEEQ